MANVRKKKSEGHQEVVLCLEDHWIVLVKPFIGFLSSIAIFFFLWMSSRIINGSFLLLSDFLLLFAFAIVIVGINRMFIALLDWELSSWIITTKRVIDFQFSPYLENDVTFIDIDKIDEIEKKKHGFWSNLFNYGDVYMNISASPVPIVFHYIPQPGKFVNLIESIRDHRLGEEIDIEVLQGIYGRKYRAVLKPGHYHKKMR